jgi:hypothetical protein
MTRQSTLHFDAVAVIGRHEVRADEQQDQPGALQVRVDLPGPVGASDKLAIMPEQHQPFAFEQAQMGMELVQPGFVFVRVGAEDLDRVHVHAQVSIRSFRECSKHSGRESKRQAGNRLS